MTLATEFFAHTDKVDGATGCWIWTAGLTTDGYGALRFDGRMRRAHRVAFFLEHGYWPYVCRHTCDNPPCVNPAHLLDGSWRDNAQDMVARGRHPNQVKTHCVHGHLLPEAAVGKRVCNVCRRERRMRDNPNPTYRLDITQCPHGHAYTPENTYFDPKRGSRICRACRTQLAQAKRERARQERAAYWAKRRVERGEAP